MDNFRRIYIKLFFSAFFWGGSAIAAKILLKEVSPSVATFIRFFGATITLFIFFRIPAGILRISFKEHFKFMLLGITGITLCYFFYFEGLFFSSTFNAALIEATIPLFTLMISVVLKKETFNKTQFIGFIIAYFGISIIISHLDINTIKTLSFNIGDILLLASTFCFGIYNVLYRQFHSKISATLQTYYIFLYGSIGLIPWLFYDFISPGNFKVSTSLVSVICSVFLALGSSVVAYLFFNQGIEALGASKASGFINYVPIITIILTLIVLREIPTLTQIIGAVVVLAGIYISQKNIHSINPSSKAIPVKKQTEG